MTLNRDRIRPGRLIIPQPQPHPHLTAPTRITLSTRVRSLPSIEIIWRRLARACSFSAGCFHGSIYTRRLWQIMARRTPAPFPVRFRNVTDICHAMEAVTDLGFGFLICLTVQFGCLTDHILETDHCNCPDYSNRPTRPTQSQRKGCYFGWNLSRNLRTA